MRHGMPVAVEPAVIALAQLTAAASGRPRPVSSVAFVFSTSDKESIVCCFRSVCRIEECGVFITLKRVSIVS